MDHPFGKEVIRMQYDKDLIAGKLRRWEKYMDEYRLPNWDDIPNFGLYMEQVVVLLSEYLDYLPPELKKEQFITAATINNYVRKEIMPEPVKKRYYRLHIAYLIIICTLKQSLSIQTITTIIAMGLTEEELKALYNNFAERQRLTAAYFVEQVREAAGPILDHDGPASPIAAKDTPDLIISSAIVSSFTKLLAEKLLLLNGKTLEDGGDILVKTKKS